MTSLTNRFACNFKDGGGQEYNSGVRIVQFGIAAAAVVVTYVPTYYRLVITIIGTLIAIISITRVSGCIKGLFASFERPA